jgi:hypothetical protein
MKKIVKTLPEIEFISIDKVESIKEKNIGIYSMDSSTKGFLIPISYKSELYWVRAVDGFERGNGWSVDEAKTFKGWLEYWYGIGVEFYYFDTPQELFKWLSE